MQKAIGFLTAEELGNRAKFLGQTFFGKQKYLKRMRNNAIR